MSVNRRVDRAGMASGGLLTGMLWIVLSGVALGTIYNTLGLVAERPWGLAWTAQDKLEALPGLEEFENPAPAPTSATGSYTTSLSDPLAIPVEALTQGLPQIPAVGRPVRVETAVVRQYYDAGAALFVDARSPEEFAEGHIPGALNLPHDLVAVDTSLVATIDTGGNPVIAYCGGEGCDVSIAVAEEFCLAGHERVAVYADGFPEWEAGGHPVESAAGGE
jgi:rhodanese-related sulfurtransferase